MKLACVRCKRKKIKCNKDEPTCNHCIAARTDCEYVARRQRPRVAQQKSAVLHLNQRLEILERSLTNNSVADIAQERQPSSPRTHTSTESGIVLPEEDIDSATDSGIPLTAENGQESWIYRMASDAQRNFQTQLAPATPLAGIDDAMLSLNEALQDLGRLRVRHDIGDRYVPLGLSPSEATECIDAFLDLARNTILPDFHHRYLDADCLRALPNIIDSPFISTDPVIKVLYTNAIHYGVQETRGSNDPLVQTTYIKVLEAVPEWLEAPPDHVLNGLTAALTTWTTFINHDYQLSWKFHCKTCQYIKLKKIDSLDVIPAKSFQEEEERNDFRFTYWHVLCTDLTFRLFFAKPTVIRWVPDKIKPPSFMTSNHMHPSARYVMILVVWVRYTLLTAEALNLIDNTAPDNRDAVFYQQTDHICTQLEELLEEWKMEVEMQATDTSPKHRALMADHIMNVYAMIVGIRRCIRNPTQINLIDKFELRAARKVVRLILDLSMASTYGAKFFAEHFISFYPFCTIFSLYEHVITCTDPEQCEQDVVALEQIGATITQATSARPSFATLQRTINALNKVARAIQDERKRQRRSSTITSPTDIYTTAFGTFEDFANSIPNLDASAWESFGNFSGADIGGAGEGFHPMGFVRAVETDFVGRNWNEHWWDMNL